MMRNIKLQYVLLIFILCLAVFFRFFWLDRIPNGIGGDELVYILTAKSIFLTGHDLTGTWNPLSIFLFRYPPGQLSAELLYLIQLPFTGAFPFSLLMARIPIAILSVGIVILLYLLAQKLFDSKSAFAVGIVAAINPWMVYIGRTGYEWTLAAFFYLLGLYLIIQKSKKAIMYSTIAFLLAFYSYIGTKIIFIPFVLLSILLANQIYGKKFNTQYKFVGTISILFTILFLILLMTNGGSRISELFLPTNPIIAPQVDYLRKISINSFLTNIYANKLSVYIQILITKLFRSISPLYLFLEGDEFFSLWRSGMLYVIDFIFLIIGSLYMFSKKKKVFIILSLFIFINTFPQIFHKNITDFSYHIALMFPFIILLIGYGITQFISGFHGIWKKVVICIMCCIYIFSVGNFIYIYAFQHPLQGYFDFHRRVLSEYVMRAQKQSIHATIYSDSNKDYFPKFLFYTNGITKSNINEVSNDMKKFSYTLNGISFSQCDDRLKISSASGTSIVDTNCTYSFDQPHVSISNLSDGGEKFRIYNDTICNKYDLHRYPQHLTINDFAIDNLSIQRFCEMYISKL